MNRVLRGCLSWSEGAEGIRLHRLTPFQLEYLAPDPQRYLRGSCPAGCRLELLTDSSRLRLDYSIHGRVRDWFAFDLFEGRRLIAEHVVKPVVEDRGSLQFCLVDSAGLKTEDDLRRYSVYLPHTVDLTFDSIQIDSHSVTAEIQQNPQKLICLGDSITQGMDALHPASTYPALLARLMGKELLNQGIGGHVFDPPFLRESIPWNPKMVTVAYGTNDWSKVSDGGEFRDRAFEFLNAVIQRFPGARIFVITPTWRADGKEARGMGTFHDLAECLSACVEQLQNIHLVAGLDLVPHLPRFFGDRRLHPNDEGSLHYGMNLLHAIQEQNSDE